MRILVALPICAALAVIFLPSISVAAQPAEDGAAIEAAISAVKPALVRIYVAEAEYSQGREVKRESSGSGVIVTKEGHIVTNHHVAGKAKRLLVTLANKEELEADLIGTDALMDIAVIKLRSDGGVEFPTAEWGDSSSLKVGDAVLAMGSPFALSQSVTSGVISNTEMIMPEFLGDSMTLDGEDVGSMVRWIGHDATIEPGNSGGPLVDMSGKIVGINEISIGLAGAIPGNLVRSVADQLIHAGKVTRSWLGLSIQPILKSSSLRKGVLVGGVLSGSPAKAAGLQPGDVLVKLGGHDVTVRFAEEQPLFNQMVSALPIGQAVETVVLRQDKEVTLRPVTQARPEAEPKPQEFKQWGMCASNLSFMEAREMKRQNQDGALVQSVQPGGPCGDAKPGIEPDDVITQADGKPVKNIADLEAITAEATKGKTEQTPMLVAFDREAEHLVTVVKVGREQMEDPGREVRKAYLPVELQVLTNDIAESLGVAGKTGVRVTQVHASTSAAKAGLKVGDLIIALDGEKIEASQPEDTEVLPTMIRQYKIGSTAKLTIVRDGKTLTVPVVLEGSRPLPREMKKYRDDNFEFTCRDIAFQDRVEQNLDKATVGILVEDVSEGGWAALSHLGSGDVIYEVNGAKIADVAQLDVVMKKIAVDKPKYVVLRVNRGVQDLFVEMEADWPK